MELFWFLVFANCLALSVSAAEDNNAKRQTFIVQVQNDLKPSVFPDVEHWYSSTLRSLAFNPLASQNPTFHQGESNCYDLLHVYKTVFHGFSAKLTSQEAQEIKKRPGILGVYPDRIRHIHTTRSPQFLGLVENGTGGLLADSDYGSSVVIGVLDTGIWPERRSFDDKDLGPVPAHWKGECTEGQAFPKTLCNKKLVGARYFLSGYQAYAGKLNETTEFRSARDSIGHGTHTASTAAGSDVPQASMLGYATGVAVGIAPKARIAVYKVCWDMGCFDSDILSALDKAVEDGVNVISLSLGGAVLPYHQDPIAIGAFGAMEKGVFVSASAGNNGPETTTVTNVAPWITTIGAGTIDRRFPADLLLENGPVITGASLYSGPSLPEKTFLPLVYAWNATVIRRNRTILGRSEALTAALCTPKSLDPELVRGKIVLCDYSGISRAAMGAAVKEAGGAGMIATNVFPAGEGLVADAYLLPALAITESAGRILREYISSSHNPRATIVFHGTQLGVKPAPVVASFSSRGPNPNSPYIVKPDVIAPGVNILAAWTDTKGPTGLPSDTRQTEFNIISGTSMACPHVSGLAALLKGAHPDWSPAVIRSALMTTAYMHDNTGKGLLDERNYTTSTTWGVGSGHVDPDKAVDPGLVYNLTVDDYLDFLCASNYTRHDIRLIARRAVNCRRKEKVPMPWNVNYPSIAVISEQSGPSKFTIEVTRTVTHVGNGASSYAVTVENPRGAVVTVDPPKMEFRNKGEKQSYKVKISAEKVEMAPGKSSEYGRLTWTDGRHLVSSPIVVTLLRYTTTSHI
ncbi:PREDICTED: subtilisin-like protease SBT1.5 [Nelumbo nucifera]|uniref:Subtilisin-like protease SBT1.5 n=1 Tax=Nelumbo nucifera TaxID=4432 RepID=A0A1U8AT93_NELNU|nr:PREDICTED: subtilisin-like protease SBT1.5 [Nelumbo nucifera]